jgi:hypothetical protein
MAYNCEQRIDELERLLIANQDCVDNVVDAYLQLEAEVAELKAKLDRYGNLLNDYSVREFKEEAYENEIFELKSKLAAESWHDASELPGDELYFTKLLVYNPKNNTAKTSWGYDVICFMGADNSLPEDKRNNYQWKLFLNPNGKDQIHPLAFDRNKINLPEGK